MISRANILEREKEFPALSLSVVRWVVEPKVEKARLREDGSDRDKFNGVNGDQVRQNNIGHIKSRWFYSKWNVETSKDLKVFLSQLSLKISCAGLVIPVRVKIENALYPQNEITVPNTETAEQEKKYMKCIAKHRLEDGIKINHKSGKNKNRNIHISNRLSQEDVID